MRSRLMETLLALLIWAGLIGAMAEANTFKSFLIVKGISLMLIVIPALLFNYLENKRIIDKEKEEII